MNGQGINIKDKNNKKDYLAKLVFYAMPNLRFLVSGQLGTGCAADFHLSDKFVSPYNQSILPGENYRRDRWSIGSEYKSFVNNPQIEWKRRPLSIRGEVIHPRHIRKPFGRRTHHNPQPTRPSHHNPQPSTRLRYGVVADTSGVLIFQKNAVTLQP